MSDNTNESLCPSCINAVTCHTWGEVKCLAQKKRIYGYKTLTNCRFYKKCGKDFKESPCQCKDCSKNPELVEEE